MRTVYVLCRSMQKANIGRYAHPAHYYVRSTHSLGQRRENEHAVKSSVLGRWRGRELYLFFCEDPVMQSCLCDSQRHPSEGAALPARCGTSPPLSPTVPEVAALEPSSVCPAVSPWASMRKGLVLRELG